MRTHALAPLLVVLAACSTSKDGWSGGNDATPADSAADDTTSDTGSDTQDTADSGDTSPDTGDTADSGTDRGTDTSDTGDTGASDPGCRSGASMHTGAVLAALPWNRAVS